jgi:hypothetical protein
MNRHIAIGGMMLVLSLVCLVLAFMVPTPASIPSALLFLAGVAYGNAMSLAFRYANERKDKDEGNN